MELTLGMYESYGNDYLVYDCVKNEYELKPEDVRNICNRRFGAGADGILVGPAQMFGKMGVKIYNPDGSEAAISGNGLCIFAKYLKDRICHQKGTGASDEKPGGHSTLSQ